MAKRNNNSRGYSRRKVDTRKIRQRFLIVCEGTKTEPNYFRSFRLPGLVIDIEGLGFSPSRLVEETKELKNKDEYDQVWCVFDRDSFPERDFNDAIREASKEGFNVAYSNEAFEIWYILHFEYLDTGISRRDYKKRLTKLLKSEYKKNSDSMYIELLDKQEDAIRNAIKLLEKSDSSNPARNNPSTTVHLLVQKLNEFIP
ncbi:MAG: RloB family protein [Cyanobacteria bacterium P01_C01_bin.89]